MKALIEYFLMVVFTLLQNRVHVFVVVVVVVCAIFMLLAIKGLKSTCSATNLEVFCILYAPKGF